MGEGKTTKTEGCFTPCTNIRSVQGLLTPPYKKEANGALWLLKSVEAQQNTAGEQPRALYGSLVVVAAFEAPVSYHHHSG